MASYEDFIDKHRNQLNASGVPELYWRKLHIKITEELFDGGETFELLRIDYGDEIKEKTDPVWQLRSKRIVNRNDPDSIYLIDHAWTFRVENARKQLREIDGLCRRMCFIMGLDETKETAETIDEIFEEMWRHVNTYSIINATEIEDRLPVYYVMDELGSGVQHGDEPNVRVVPFVYLDQQIVYSLLFPISTIESNEIIRRDYAEGVTEPLERAAILLPWQPATFDEIGYENVEVGDDYFVTGRVQETLPTINEVSGSKDQYKVYTEYVYVAKYLKSPRFVLVENEDEADIWWLTRHFKDYAELFTTNRYVNQFPYEYVVTVKDLLPLVMRRSKSAECLPITYNLKNELPQFVNCYRERASRDLDNHWIVKPFNLARGLDTHVTNNLNYVLRLTRTGPKVAQKYIERPLLFYRDDIKARVKFDVRYVILLKSCSPLDLYVYNNFFVRFANAEYALSDLDDYKCHFTVMNYKEDEQLKDMLCDEFKLEFDRQQQQTNWHSVDVKIREVIKEVFVAATRYEPPRGIAQCARSRALYAADLMLEKTIDGDVKPKLLEINWTPDCRRACEYYPSFYDEVFHLLFLDEVSDAFCKL